MTLQGRTNKKKPLIFFVVESFYASNELFGPIYEKLKDQVDFHILDLTVRSKLELGRDHYDTSVAYYENMGLPFTNIMLSEEKYQAWDKRFRMLGSSMTSNNEQLFIGWKLKKLIDNLSPDLLLTPCNYKNFVVRYFSRYTNIPVVILPHSGFGINYGTASTPFRSWLRGLRKKAQHLLGSTLLRYPYLHGKPSNMYVLAWSEDHLDTTQIDYHVQAPYTLHCMGNPRFDKYINYQKSEKYKKDADARLRWAYCTQPLEQIKVVSSQAHKDKFNAFVKTIAENLNIDLDIYVHPRENPDYYKTLFQTLDNVRVASHGTKVADLEQYDLIVSGWSTVLIEGLLSRFPVLSLNPENLYDYNIYSLFPKVFQIVTDQATLAEICQDYPRWRKEFDDQISDRIKIVNTYDTGLASERVAEYLLQLLDYERH